MDMDDKDPHVKVKQGKEISLARWLLTSSSWPRANCFVSARMICFVFLLLFSSFKATVGPALVIERHATAGSRASSLPWWVFFCWSSDVRKILGTAEAKYPHTSINCLHDNQSIVWHCRWHWWKLHSYGVMRRIFDLIYWCEYVRLKYCPLDEFRLIGPSFLFFFSSGAQFSSSRSALESPLSFLCYSYGATRKQWPGQRSWACL